MMDEIKDPKDAVAARHNSGLCVHVYRSTIDGELVVDVDSTALVEADEDAQGCPVLRIYVNDARIMDHGEPVPESKWGDWLEGENK